MPHTIRSNYRQVVLSSTLDYLPVFSRVLRDSTTRFVGPSVRPSITIDFFGVFAVFGLTAPAQMIW